MKITKRRIAVGTVTVFAGLCLLGSQMSAPATSSAPVAASEATASGVTMAQFSQLETGMSYADAVAILGGEGTVLSESTIGDLTTVMYLWAGTGSLGANMNATFQNDALVVKAQHGLV